MPNTALIEALLSRRSVLAANMTEPGPNEEQLALILKAAHRVPDHGKIGPWRFIVFKNDGRARAGHILRERFHELNPEATDKLLEFEQARFTRAPIVIAVVSSPIEHKVPTWEQELSAGASCQNILLASQGLGFCAQWLTEWYAFDDTINNELGLTKRERIAGFMYIGTACDAPKERVRPDLSERISTF